MSLSNPKSRPQLLVSQQSQKKLKKISCKNVRNSQSYHKKKVKLSMIDLLQKPQTRFQHKTDSFILKKTSVIFSNFIIILFDLHCVLQMKLFNFFTGITHYLYDCVFYDCVYTYMQQHIYIGVNMYSHIHTCDRPFAQMEFSNALDL